MRDWSPEECDTIAVAVSDGELRWVAPRGLTTHGDTPEQDADYLEDAMLVSIYGVIPARPTR